MKITKLFFKKEFFPKHEDNRMNNEGDLEAAKNKFLKNRFPNVDFLLSQRYRWMNNEIRAGQKILEVGSGAGFSTLYLNDKIILTDAVKNKWIDLEIDATKMDDNSIDIIIASHTIHHFYNPAKFFIECERVLKPGGKILISEIHTSFFMKLILKIMRHEVYSYDVDVFDTQSICNDPKDLWSANCAIPEIMFSETKKFHSKFKQLRIIDKEYTEFLIFPLSGGVISKTKVPKLPFTILRVIYFIDSILIKISKSTFALGLNVVIEKR